ncbi:hypothetical protein [Pseudokineococcus sp. 1T1Z-3]|uniref:hypothetical protein n=1 Tax=Pseudokineococcus sp. 1T1Z-3 TaxID=3132745 RepID=UPI00309935CB
MIFRAMGDGRPCPERGHASGRGWSARSPRQVCLDVLVTTRRTPDLDALLAAELEG